MNSRASIAAAVVVVGLLVLVAACANRTASKTPPLAAQSKAVDLQRYMGAWYVIANIPYFAEKGKIASRDVYALDADGKVDTTYVYRKSFDSPEKTVKSVGEIVPNTGNAHWIVRFFKLFKSDYLILDLAPDYSWVLIGQPDRKLGWVLARDAAMDDARYATLLQRFQTFGYDTATFKRVVQSPAQLDRDGFQ